MVILCTYLFRGGAHIGAVSLVVIFWIWFGNTAHLSHMGSECIFYKIVSTCLRGGYVGGRGGGGGDSKRDFTFKIWHLNVAVLGRHGIPTLHLCNKINKKSVNIFSSVFWRPLLIFAVKKSRVHTFLKSVYVYHVTGNKSINSKVSYEINDKAYLYS